MPSRINRNIVECKCSSHRVPLPCCPAVLIETLWNVNDETHKDYTGLHVVLIETLWNVNTIIPSNENRPNGVLIETLWNVNNSNSSISGRTTEY